LPRISQLTALTAVDNADELAIVDVSASVTKKITRSAFLSSAPLPNNTVTTAAITQNSVDASKLATNAITLGTSSITSNFTTSSTTPVQITGLTSTVTIPAGGRRIKITVFGRTVFNANSSYNTFTIWDGTVGSGTQLSSTQVYNTTNIPAGPIIAMAIVTPSAGSKTYNIGMHVTSGSGILEAAATYPAFILVETI